MAIFLGRPAPFATYYKVVRVDKRKNNRKLILPIIKKNNGVLDYKGPVKIELLKGAGLLTF